MAKFANLLLSKIYKTHIDIIIRGYTKNLDTIVLTTIQSLNQNTNFIDLNTICRIRYLYFFKPTINYKTKRRLKRRLKKRITKYAHLS
jgi:hypothetical protein